ncbi:conserved hypothetical protein [Neospora caninum Liverpool]|uniref:Uncharacterized protein n=1 Tax=Neospora caninum (strain Liverpool) TaxID=572307 RepID=F0VIQ6_NEOCL|nr:conserved hypothetical protein [Neospora caninum Liverpool]CBZ53617.1 conserved hypothetical protein [Neospora caninum Liverpool]CEL67608.1 TPA: hypothetical protein BN1204_034040 [Neospora caninum Liverpool]|eukprot:XP_003883649.1 conserved hypothetical protein [Neospora caninum Liverpool]
METRTRDDDAVPAQMLAGSHTVTPELVFVAEPDDMNPLDGGRGRGGVLHLNSGDSPRSQERVAPGRLLVSSKREELPVPITSSAQPQEGTDASGDESAWSDASSDAEPVSLMTPTRDWKPKGVGMKLSVSRCRVSQEGSLLKARGTGILLSQLEAEGRNGAYESVGFETRNHEQLGTGPPAHTPEKAGEAVGIPAAAWDRPRTASSGKKLQNLAARTTASRLARRRGVPGTKKTVAAKRLFDDNEEGGQRTLRQTRGAVSRAAGASAFKNRRGRRRVAEGAAIFMDSEKEYSWMRQAYLKHRASDYADDLFDSLGLLSADDFLDKEMDRDALLLDYDDSLLDDEEDLFFPGDPADSRFCLPDGCIPSAGRRHDGRVSGISSLREEKSLRELEKDEEDATTWAVVRQMMGSLGVRDWAGFLQIQAEFWLYSSAHRQALITATAAERFLREEEGKKAGGAEARKARETLRQEVERNESARAVQTAGACDQGDPQARAATPVHSRADMTPALAVKTVAACALRQFDRSGEYLRQLRARDLAVLSEPLQAYLEEAVHFLAENTNPSFPSATPPVPRV